MVRRNHCHLLTWFPRLRLLFHIFFLNSNFISFSEMSGRHPTCSRQVITKKHALKKILAEIFFVLTASDHSVKVYSEGHCFRVVLQYKPCLGQKAWVSGGITPFRLHCSRRQRTKKCRRKITNIHCNFSESPSEKHRRYDAGWGNGYLYHPPALVKTFTSEKI